MADEPLSKTSGSIFGTYSVLYLLARCNLLMEFGLKQITQKHLGECYANVCACAGRQETIPYAHNLLTIHLYAIQRFSTLDSDLSSTKKSLH